MEVIACSVTCRCAPPIQLVVHARLDHIKALGGIGRYGQVEYRLGGRQTWNRQSKGSVRAFRAKIEVVVLDKGRPTRRECIFDARAERPAASRLADASSSQCGALTKAGGQIFYKKLGSRRRHSAFAVLPSPTAFGVDQSTIDCCTDTRRDSAEALDFVMAAESQRTESLRIEATAATINIGPMSVSLDAEHEPAGLPVGSELASEKPATDRVRSGCPAEEAQPEEAGLG